MANLRPQRYQKKYGATASPELLQNVLQTVRLTGKRSPTVAPILTLNHLALSAHVPWPLLRRWISRNGPDPYYTFRIPKRGTRRRWEGDGLDYRRICCPHSALMRLQRFLVQKVLNNVDPHISSTAFAPKCNIIKAVEPHLGCQWLIKIDVSGFFESISELAVYRVFRSIGYQPLISFELARLCTRRPGMPSKSRQSKRWLVRSNKPMVISSYEPATEPDVREIARLKEKDASEDRVREDLSDILDGRVSDNLSRQGDLFSSSDDPIYQKYMSFDSEDELFSVDDFMDEDFLSSEEEIQPFVRRMGYLPQGAPTSPMLANLAVYGLDCELEELAAQFSLIYTRYADDMAFSTLNKNSLDRAIAKKFVAEVYRKFAHWGLRPNLSKTHIRGPGSRKMILGLLVNDDVVRLPKSYFDNLKMHFYYIRKNGPGAHATARGFASSLQLRHHVEGLIHHAIQVEPKRGQKWMAIHNSIKWPI